MLKHKYLKNTHLNVSKDIYDGKLELSENGEIKNELTEAAHKKLSAHPDWYVIEETPDAPPDDPDAPKGEPETPPDNSGEGSAPNEDATENDDNDEENASENVENATPRKPGRAGRQGRSPKEAQ